jgi:hypothetical protein
VFSNVSIVPTLRGRSPNARGSRSRIPTGVRDRWSFLDPGRRNPLHLVARASIESASFGLIRSITVSCLMRPTPISKNGLCATGYDLGGHARQDPSRAVSAEQRPREARRAALALVRDLRALVDGDIHARRLHPPLRLRVAIDGQCDARGQREDVGSHRAELFLGHLDDGDVSLREQFEQTDRHQRRVSDHQVVVQRREQRKQVETRVGSPQPR